MFATFIGRSPANPGDLVLVEVPGNCTIHSADAARLSQLRTLATQLRACRDGGIPYDQLHGLLDRIAFASDAPDSDDPKPAADDDPFESLTTA
jgi:hypothetical protein